MDKILYISAISPFHYSNGSQQRSYLIYKSLVSKYTVDVLLFSHEYDEYNKLDFRLNNENIWILNYVSESKNKYPLYSKGAVFPRNDYFWKEVQKILKTNSYKYIFVRYLDMVFSCGLENYKSLIIDIDDLPSDKFYSRYKTLTFGKKKINYLVKTILSKLYINNLVKKAHFSFVSNPKQVIGKKSSYLPNIPFPFYEKSITSTKNFEETDDFILFIGYMGYYPNYLGIDIFIKNVWTKINKELPNTKFKIAGKDLPEKWIMEWQEYKNIEYLGFVDDLFEEYNKCRAVVIPIYHGAGTNIKVLEAMKAKKAIVVSSFAARGFRDLLVNNQNILISNSYSKFAKNVIEVLSNKELNNKLASNALNDIEQNYSFDNFSKIILKNI